MAIQGSAARSSGPVSGPAQRRRRHQDALDIAQAQRHRVRIHHHPHPDGAIHAIGDEVGRAVAEHPIHLHARIAAQIGFQRIEQLLLAEGMGHHHPQPSLGFGMGAVQGSGEGLPVAEQLLGLAIAALAILGESQGMGRALYQAHLQGRLQRLQAAADGGLGGAELARRRRQTAGLDDADEGLEQIEAVMGKGGIHTSYVYPLYRAFGYKLPSFWRRMQPIASRPGAAA
ncbi:hypothetical protein Q3H58_003723 [Pseudomonas psychrotolerans]|nr:hypothetical protein [Pseudomonas psychrotolerans]